MKVVYIGIAGALGTITRYLIASTIDRGLASSFPAGTVVVNALGCLLAGVLIAVISQRFPQSEVASSILMIGFLGGFTTFSAFALQTFTLFSKGQLILALTNLLVSNIVGVLAVWAGYSLAS